MKLTNNQAGDTIVEVLIAILVMGTVLAGAYATANHSLTNVRDAQEHQEATSLAESQLDALGSTSATKIPTANSPNASFCFDSNNAPMQGAACTNLLSGDFNQFSVAITLVQPPPAAPDLRAYQAQVQWPRLGGGTDQVELFYQPDNPQ